MISSLVGQKSEQQQVVLWHTPSTQVQTENNQLQQNEINNYNRDHLQICIKKIGSAATYEENVSGWNSLLKGQEFGVTFFTSKDPVFIIDSSPNIVFKMDKDLSRGPMNGCISKHGTEHRFENHQFAVSIVEEGEFDRLVIPKTQKIFSNFRHVIVEQKLEFNTDLKAQESAFASDDSSLDEAIRQLAVFIIKTGYCDVKVANNPIIEENEGIKKIALLDLEHSFRDNKLYGQRQGNYTGIFGGKSVSTNLGLINMLGPHQAKIVCNIATELLPNLSDTDKEKVEKIVNHKS